MFKLFTLFFIPLSLLFASPYTFISETQSLGVTVAPPAPVAQTTPDAKIIPVGKSYAVVFSNKTFLIVRLEDVSNFLQWMKSAENSTPPPYSIVPTDNPQFPYKIVALFTGEEFLLQKPTPPNVWKLALGDWHLYTLNENMGIFFGLTPDGLTNSNASYWQLDNTTNEPETHEWKTGDSILIINVSAQSSKGQAVQVGHLLFRFENKAEALQWLSDHSGSATGYWVSKVEG